MSLHKILLVLISFGVSNILTLTSNEMGVFLQDFIAFRRKPASILSYLKFSPTQNTILSEYFARKGIPYAVNNKPIHSNETIMLVDNTIFLLELEDRRYLDILNKAQSKTGTLQTPACWIVFYNVKNTTNNTTLVARETVRLKIENLIEEIYIAVNTEVYISIVDGEELDIYLIYKKRPYLPFIWEYSGKWNARTKLHTLHPASSSDSLAMRRRNMERLQVATTAVFSSKQSLLDSKDFAQNHVDSPTKIMYYMAVHLFEWINATGYFNITNTWGYKGPDGTFKGIMKELEEGRSDFSGSILILSKDRMHIVEYVIPPAAFDLNFIFRKPALASTSNIYILPFTNGVWIASVVLFLISLTAVIAASFREKVVSERPAINAYDSVAESFQDILCCVFQQGTAHDPVTSSSRLSVLYVAIHLFCTSFPFISAHTEVINKSHFVIAEVTIMGRQILFSGLLAFMFLYTAYAANVVALLQSSDNNINSVESLLNSRLQCGAHNVVYNRFIFNSETRPAHRALWLKKGLPQGEKYFLSVDEGIRRVKTEMFAFHVDPIAGFYTIQKTFLEHEKCNIGMVKYANFKYPYFGVARHSHIKEVLRIGAIRIKESGVQDRTNRRITARIPTCSSGSGMFTAVDLLDVAPAFQCLLALYALALIFFGIELLLHRHRRVKFTSEID